MVIQERDREILRRCYEQQFLLIDHVVRYFFKGSWRRAYERMQELEEAGLIRREPFFATGPKSVIRLGRHGLGISSQLHPVEIKQNVRIDPFTVEHDALVTSVALRLHQLWDGVWVPERALKQGEYDQIPDGVFVFESGNQVAIEVENTLKGKTRFIRLLNRWRFDKMRLILFVATKPHIYQAIQRFLMEGPSGIPFALTLWSELDQGEPYAWCPKGNLQIFNRRSF